MERARPGAGWPSAWPRPASRSRSARATPSGPPAWSPTWWRSGRVGTWSSEGADNAGAAAADFVVVATPWDSAVATVRSLREPLAGKVVVSMVNALVKEGREMLALMPPRGSMAAAIQAALPESMVAAAFHHLPASEMEDLESGLQADVLVCSDHPVATTATVGMVELMRGLRPLDAGSLNQAAAIEAFTAVCITLNIRHKAHSTLRMAGI